MSQDIQRVAIDSGGTFTDFVVLLANGERSALKSPQHPMTQAAQSMRALHLFRSRRQTQSCTVLP